MKGVKDLLNYFKQKQSTSKPTLVESGLNDVFQADLAIVGKEIKKAVKPRKQYINISPKLFKKMWANML